MTTTADRPEAPSTPGGRRTTGEVAGVARILRRPEVGAAAAALAIFIFFAITTDAFVKPAAPAPGS